MDSFRSAVQKFMMSLDAENQLDERLIERKRTIKLPEEDANTSNGSHRIFHRQSFSNHGTMRSIRRGSEDWLLMLRPFVSNMVFRSLVKRRSETDHSFTPYSTDAAVMFVDMSGYSKITCALAHRGAHVLSGVVNSYLYEILHVVNEYSGDVVKFAGDAILIVWEGKEEELSKNVLCAAKCALELQRRTGYYEIEDTGLMFRIHIGLCCGKIEADIFEAPRHTTMQRLYHSVGGDPLIEIGDLTDLAKSGQVCVSGDVQDILGSLGTYEIAEESYPDASLLLSLDLDEEAKQRMDEHIDRLVLERNENQIEKIAEEFIHPSILKRLLHTGNSPTQIAQMRNLCVLFIAMTSGGNPVNWLMEVQGVLDAHRCPIVQIIDDDKGVHIVAAVNLYESVPDATNLALDACRSLVDKEVGCAIGMAMGSTFCGVTGCASVACRWDITGAPPVRAARLMQYAIAEGFRVAIDQSVYNLTTATPRIQLRNAAVRIKGSPRPVPIYTLSPGRLFVAPMILDSFALAPVHQEVVNEITEVMMGPKPRGAVILTGPPQAGKKSIFQRAAGLACLVPVLHVCDAGGGHLQIARTIATWFLHFRDKNVVNLARILENQLDAHHWSRAHDECIALLNEVMAIGYRVAIVVDRVQFIDNFSLSLVRECLDGRIRLRGNAQNSFSASSSVSSSISEGSVKGKLFFLCCHVPLYNSRTHDCVYHDLKRTRDIKVPLFKIGSVSPEELRVCLCHSFDATATDDWLMVYGQQSGYKVGYFYERVRAMRVASATALSEGKPAYSLFTKYQKLYIPPRMNRLHRTFKVMQVSPNAAMRFSQQYDELPPRHQLFMKVITIATPRCFYECPIVVAREAIDDLIDEGIEEDRLETVVEELVSIHIIEVSGEGTNRVIRLSSPAVGDVVMDVCTPQQIESISTVLLQRMKPWIPRHFAAPMLCAFLCGRNGKCGRQKELFRQAHKQMEHELRDSPRLMHYMLLLEDEINEAGYTVEEIIGKPIGVERVSHAEMADPLKYLKNYFAPVSYGPMIHSLHVIFRNIVMEVSRIHGKLPEGERLARDSKSALARYHSQLLTLEHIMAEEGLDLPDECIEEEISLLEILVKEAKDEEEVERKALLVLEEWVELHTTPRLQRLYQLADKLRVAPSLHPYMQSAPEAIRLAYEAMRHTENRADAPQHALVTLATFNWMPTGIPEHLPLPYYLTVAKVKNAVLRRLTPEELNLFKHQHSTDDLEVFLLTTAFLAEGSERACSLENPT